MKLGAVLVALAACHAAPAAGPPAPVAGPTAPAAGAAAVGFARAMGAAFAARDASAVAARFAEDASVLVVGDREQRGRAAIERDAAAIFAAYRDVRLSIGRIWIDAPVAVIELVLGGHRGDRRIGVAGAAIVRFDRGLARDVRIYLDLATLWGQLDPRLLPDGAEIRGLEPAPATGTFTAARSAAETRNVEISNQIWSALSAHDVDRVMAPAHTDYRYFDYAAPRALDRAGTYKLVAGFLAAVTDFTIAERPTQLAAGDYVLTEVVEHAAFRGAPIVLHALDIKRIVGGQVLEEWQYSNYFEILSQVRGRPAPALR
jgi:SnoaL-like domain